MTNDRLYKTFVTAILSVLMIACAVEADEAPKKNNLESLVGYYLLPSPLCSSQITGECEKSIDCLQIHKKNSTHYQVELYSVQANQHICAFDIEMGVEDNRLHYQDEAGRKIFLTIDSSQLILHTNEFTPSPGFCGAKAVIDGLTYPLSSKQPEDKICFKNE